MSQPTKELTGKIALITGASRGIGAAIAHDLADRGADLFLTWSLSPTSASSAATVITQIRFRHPSIRIHGIGVDFLDPSAPASVLAAFRTHYPGDETNAGRVLDILVNNAGTATLAPLATATPESFTHLLDLNLRAPFFLTQALLPYLRAPARIINMSSVVARTGFAFGPAYAASKAGLEAFTRCWAKELGKDGTTVNAVAPAIIRTELTEGLFGAEDLQVDAAATPVQGRVGEVGDVVGIVGFLAGEGSRWVSGQVIHASGGMTMI